MNILDEYRRNARECQRMADNAANPDDKASWLRLAASWLSLIRNEPRRMVENSSHSDHQDRERSNPSWPKASRKDSQASQ